MAGISLVVFGSGLPQTQGLNNFAQGHITNRLGAVSRGQVRPAEMWRRTCRVQLKHVSEGPGTGVLECKTRMIWCLGLGKVDSVGSVKLRKGLEQKSDPSGTVLLGHWEISSLVNMDTLRESCYSTWVAEAGGDGEGGMNAVNITGWT